ncbi:MAG TPA: HNH endonuclease [Bacteroidia bacterium]|jgi:hypothetical protein|nr:HNH endonuclease [Bacteroidia bacterium]
MKFELKPYSRNVSDDKLLDDLKRVAKICENESFSSREYIKRGGKFSTNTISLRFNGWNNALEKAGLTLLMQQNISERELFENLEEVWIKLGEQPIYRDMKRPLSKYAASPYTARFGTWRKALEAFIEYMNKDVKETQVEEIIEPIQEKETIFKHKTKREPSSRLKVQVLMRDGNKCRLCGITVSGDNIHFDHIKPWSKGGETTLDNLQVLCAEHNLAKGNLEY